MNKSKQPRGNKNTLKKMEKIITTYEKMKKQLQSMNEDTKKSEARAAALIDERKKRTFAFGLKITKEKEVLYELNSGFRQRIPMGYLTFLFLVAAKRDNPKNPGRLAFNFYRGKKWKNTMVMETSPEEISELTRHIEAELSQGKIDIDVLSNSFKFRMEMNLKNPPRIAGYEDDGYIIECKNIIGLIFYELQEMKRQKRKSEKCYCGKWYFRQPGQKSVHCPECKKTPSRRKKDQYQFAPEEYAKRNEANTIKVKKWRDSKKLLERKPVEHIEMVNGVKYTRKVKPSWYERERQ
jgi:hypothetical protein